MHYFIVVPHTSEFSFGDVQVQVAIKTEPILYYDWPCTTLYMWEDTIWVYDLVMMCQDPLMTITEYQNELGLICP